MTSKISKKLELGTWDTEQLKKYMEKLLVLEQRSTFCFHFSFRNSIPTKNFIYVYLTCIANDFMPDIINIKTISA